MINLVEYSHRVHDQFFVYFDSWIARIDAIIDELFDV
jgi:hypothetical protein